jgi:hypothetical protein
MAGVYNLVLEEIQMRPLAGIKDAARQGYGVKENSELLRRYAYLEQRCMLLGARHLAGVPEWELKHALGRHLWEDAEHATALRQRVTELRTSATVVDRVPDERLALLMDEAERAESSLEVLVALYGVVKPALLAAYEEHLATTNPLVDFPTGRVLRSIIQEEREQLEWGREALAELCAEPAVAEQAHLWSEHLDRYLVAADLASQRPTLEPLPRGRSALPERPSPVPTRDDRFPIVGEYEPLPPDDPRAKLLRMMKVRMNEMGAAECVAATMVETRDMPWEYYRQLARHLWDEVRHSAFGEVALREEGYPRYDAFPERVAILDLYFALSPLERYTLLGIAIENGAMKYPPGKRLEYEWCRDEARHPLMTTFQDYDWADEVTHAQIARRWCQPQFGGDGERMRAVAAELRALIPVFTERWSWENRAPDVSDARKLAQESIEVASPYDAT